MASPTASSTRTRASDLSLAAPPSLGYHEAVAALQARGRFGINLGLERMTRLLDELEHPERSLRGALVGGTNGKGSVVAMVRSVLQAAGHRVGTMPKPHLVSYRERIAVDGEPVSRERFAAAIAAVLPVADRLTASLGPPTEFEVLTAAALLELARSRLDVALVEVGLGGRLDATNAVDLGVAAVTNVQHDHERWLGSTLARIGAEKAAIIKAGDLAVTGALGRGLAPILERCSELGVTLRRAGRGQAYGAKLLDIGWDGTVVDLRGPTGEYRELRVGLLGGHQAANAAVALAALDAIAENGARRASPLEVDERAIRAGMATTRWPGRMEILDGAPVGAGRVLLDGAHNPAGARALAAALAALGVREMPLVLGAMRGKRIGPMLRALLPLAPLPVFTAVAEPGARPPGELLGAWHAAGGTGGTIAADPAAALAEAARLQRADEPLVVAGSLYLVGAIRGLLTGEEGP
ncbi:MAG TPA: Mur ligase family protein [Candidatus Limnocylindria bacterium]|nr:Mur ligase family protein [Candidatus Limnocylindria bacterium]